MNRGSHKDDQPDFNGSNEELLHPQGAPTHVAAPKTSGISISPILQRSRQDDSAIAKIPLVLPFPSIALAGIVGSTCRNFTHVPNAKVCLSCLVHTYVIVEILFLREKYTWRCNAEKKVPFRKLRRRNKIRSSIVKQKLHIRRIYKNNYTSITCFTIYVAMGGLYKNKRNNQSL